MKHRHRVRPGIVGAALLLAASAAQAAGLHRIPLTAMPSAAAVNASSPELIFVTNNNGGAVRAYPTTANGNVTPTRTISGANTGLKAPTGIAVAPDGRIGVADDVPGSGQIHALTFAAGANGNASPLTAISCGGTGIPFGAAFDSRGNLYVTNNRGVAVAVFAPAANGCVTNDRFITNAVLGLPEGVHVTGNGMVYVAEAFGVVVYAPGARANAVPVATITGSNTGISGGQAADVTVDAAGEIIVANEFSIDVFAANANGNVAPIRTIAGSNTLLNGANGIALDAAGNIYVANVLGNTITAYANGANGNVAPLRMIAGPSTGLTVPYKIAIGP